MRRLAWFLATAVTGLLAAAILAGAEPDRIRDAHPKHAENGVTCEVCHAAADSKAGTDNLLPEMETCGACHTISDEAGCGFCHTNAEAPGAAPRVVSSVQKFPHDRHVASGMACETCHGKPAGPRLPSKPLCRGCHETAPDGTDCALCHAGGESLRPRSHSKGWDSFHGVEARTDEEACAVCHTQKDCQGCHSGDNLRPRSHRLNYEFDHAVDARGNETACAACHEDPSYCQSCHAARHVLPRDHSLAGWLVRGSGGRHAEEGRFDLESCIACHESGLNASICVECHGR
jgi:hypothetical protein